MADFLNEYIDMKNKANDHEDMAQKEESFFKVVSFIDRIFPNQGFAKAPGVVGVSKPYFEAIAIGAYMALLENPSLTPHDLAWSKVNKKQINRFFTILTCRYHTHTPQKLKERIDYAKKMFLES